MPSDEECLKEFRLNDDTTFISFFNVHATSNIVYTDLKVLDNSTVHLSPVLMDYPVSQIYDGNIVF